MGIWDDAFAHRGREEGDAGLVDEFADSGFGSGVGGAFTNDYQGGLCGLEPVRDLKDLCFFSSWSWWVRDLCDYFSRCSFALDKVRGKVHKGCAWSTIPGRAKSTF